MRYKLLRYRYNKTNFLRYQTGFNSTITDANFFGVTVLDCVSVLVLLFLLLKSSVKVSFFIR